MTTNSINNINPNDFYVQKTASGATVAETISQTSDSVGATARQIISVAGTTADDPCMKFNVGATSGFAVGPDNSASDIMKVVTGSNVNPTSGTAIMTITSGGTIQKPLQPSFLAYLSADVGNVTGDGTAYTVICNTEIFDTNSDYAHATGIFTAPVTGVYCFYTFGLVFGTGGVNQSSGNTFLATSNINYNGQWYNPINAVHSSTLSFVGNYLVDMDAGDTASMIFTVGPSGGKNNSVSGGTNDGYYQTYFSGNLEC